MCICVYIIYTDIYIYKNAKSVVVFCGQPLTRASQVPPNGPVPGPGTASGRTHSAAVHSPRGTRRHENDEIHMSQSLFIYIYIIYIIYNI